MRIDTQQTGAAAAAQLGQAWKLTRNCSMAPATCCIHLGVLGGLNLLIAAAFAALGYPVVAVFCTAQAIALAAALFVYAKHACDGETIELTQHALLVRSVTGGTCRDYRFEPHWTRLEVRGRADALELCSGRLRVRVGRHVCSQQRRLFASQLQTHLARGLRA